MKIQKLLEALNELLEPEKFRDYCPNGLQVQGKKEVKNIVCGVSASEALINEAVKRDADTIIVYLTTKIRGLSALKERELRSC